MRQSFRFWTLLPLIALLLSSISIVAKAQERAREKTPDQSQGDQKRETSGKDKTRFIRIQTKQKKPVALQTAISRYESSDPKAKATVDLIGVVHIGDKEYYKKLNELFKEYDVVLYELVAPEGTRIDRKSLEANNNPLRLLQSMPQKMLALESQLEQIDYKAKNFVHADLTPSEISRKLAERGESSVTLFLDAASAMIKQQNLAQQKGSSAGNPGNEMASLLETLNDPNKMKLMMAQQFTQSDAMDLGLGTSVNRILIADRNEEAIKELGRQVFLGHKKIAIFYGAAHMPDFQERLAKDYNMKLKKQTWLNAWDLTRKPKRSSDDPTQLLLELLKEIGK